MKIRILVVLTALALMLPTAARADEGMWLLSLIGKNYDDMRRAGFQLTPEDIYSVNRSCLKDAIVGLGNAGQPFWHFCTGEIISSKGLVSTNHHCGYGKLQEHSTVEHDYLRDGFWAYTLEQELPNPGLTASVLVRMEDVTAKVTESITDDMSESDRTAALRKACKEIEDAAVAGTQYSAQVKSMFNGNQFFLFVHIIYRDVRLVGAPPSSMGKFGGDTDNWSWPRHTCDFSLFRIYTAPDGSPADYSKDNVPLNPKHHLPVSAGELNDGDFAMVMGFPGTTNRFLTSYGLAETMNVTNKLRYEIRTVKINILRDEMAADQATRIKYASKYASCSNYWKYSNEQNKALRNLNTLAVKQQIEQEYSDWARFQRNPKYNDALGLIREGYAVRRESQEANMYLYEGILAGPEAPLFAAQMGRAFMSRLTSEQPEQKGVMQKVISLVSKKQKGDLTAYRPRIAAFYKDYDQQVEQRLAAALFGYVYAHMDAAQCPEFLQKAQKKYKGDWSKYVDDLYKKSIFANQEALAKFIDKPSVKQLEDDPLVKVGTEALERYIDLTKSVPSQTVESLQRGIRSFTDGVLQINDGKKLMAPDANSTIRLTYGNVMSYEPKDGVSYHYYTTIDGVLQKEDPENDEFIVPERLKELYKAGNFGTYTNRKGEMPACFITNNDITGGNSGSPVINGKGVLIGLAFDGNSEAMSGDIDFEENLQRCICLDSRYMLWVIDIYAGAKNLIEEMDIVR
ncbi:MAG: S46 family peptidase [Bacteroidales bacterium]|nr:S46 family peptidase [Bacteroidales bacterium]